MCTEEVPGVGGMSTRISERMPLNHMEAGCTIRSYWEGTKLRRRAYASGVVHPRELEAEMVHDHPGAASHHYHGCAPHSTRDSILFSRDQGALMQEEMYYARERGHMRAMDRPAVEALPAARPAPAPATAKPDEHANPAGSAQRMEHAAQALGFHHPILMVSLADISHKAMADTMAMADMDFIQGSTMLAWDILAWVEHTATAMAWDVLSMDMDMDILAWDTLVSVAAPITPQRHQAQWQPRTPQRQQQPNK